MAAASTPTINQTPQTLTATNIAGANTATAGTPLTLVTTANSGVTLVSSGGVTVWSSGTVIPANTLILDGLPGIITPFNTVVQPSSGNAMVSLYDPTKAIARSVRIPPATADDSGEENFYTVAGYDLYGFPMTETITGVATAVAYGKKAFKFISSITPSGTLHSTGVTVGTGDVFGFPLRVNTVGFAEVWWANTQSTNLATPFGTASAYTFADVTSPATSTTGDPRGTIYIGTAAPSNATRTLQVFVTLDTSSFGAADALFGPKPA